MPQSLVMRAKGIYTNSNEFSEVPDGALGIGRNIVIDQDGVMEPRRGFDKLIGRFLNASDRAKNLLVYQDQLIAHYGADKLAYYDALNDVWVDYSGTYAVPDSTLGRIRGTSANQNFYFVTSNGIKKLDAYNGVVTSAGGIKAIDGESFLSIDVTGDITSGSPVVTNLSSTEALLAGQVITGTGIPGSTAILSVDSATQITLTNNATATTAGVALNISTNIGFMADNTQVAYRIVWGIRDANNNIITGAPSQRIIVANASGGSRDVFLKSGIPDGITTTHFYQVYRSGQSASSTSEPNDELALVYEDNPTSAQISAKMLTIYDNTPDDLRGALLYTNPSQEGILQSNEPPPFAKDIAVFRDSTFFGNTKSKQRLIITMTAVGGADGIQLDDVITIGSVVYTAKATENIALNQFALVTGGSPAQNIEDTSKSLIRVINRSALNTTIYASYISGFDDLPGQILLEERGINGSSYAVTMSTSRNAFNPRLPTSGTTVSSSNDQFINGLYFSKFQQPEAVPITNFFRVGAADKAILRIIPLRDALFILKEDGVYRLTGVDSNSFRVDLLDNTTTLLAPESAVNLNNQIYCLADQGVATITDTGVSIVSRPIENQLLSLYSLDINGVRELSFGITYESERKYILFMITEDTDTYPTQAFVFNTVTAAWTKWDLDKTCGIVRPIDNKLYLGSALDNAINIERKNRDFTDYVDDEFVVNILTHDGDKIVTLSSLAGVEVGDVLQQSSTKFTVITAIDNFNGEVTLRDKVEWSIAAATILKAIETEIEFLPQAAKNPGQLKHYREISCIFKSAIFSTFTVGFKSDLSFGVENILLERRDQGLFGLIPWGSGMWGGGLKSFGIRTYVVKNKQRCSQLTVRLSLKEGYAFFKLNGISLIYEPMSERITR